MEPFDVECAPQIAVRNDTITALRNILYANLDVCTGECDSCMLKMELDSERIDREPKQVCALEFLRNELMEKERRYVKARCRDCEYVEADGECWYCTHNQESAFRVLDIKCPKMNSDKEN